MPPLLFIQGRNRIIGTDPAGGRGLAVHRSFSRGRLIVSSYVRVHSHDHRSRRVRICRVESKRGAIAVIDRIKDDICTLTLRELSPVHTC